MIKIYNKKKDKEIIIDDSVDWVQFTPRDYEKNPYVRIELKGFDFLQHAQECEDCKSLLNAFGKDSIHWYVSYSDKVFRLDTSSIGQKTYGKNDIRTIVSGFESGTKMTLAFHPLPTNKSELQYLLAKEVEMENYEKACIIRDLINED